MDEQQTKKYDVFLSFRGEDTRRSFASHLYKYLKEEKVETYVDDQLEKGDEISAALTKAIENSHVSVVIFSENYASSKWCLGELSKILECKKEKGQIVIPVFYNINPSHVRKQTGSYEQAFAKHEGESRCNEWKDALTEVANLVGWDSQTYRTDPEILKDIVEDVLQKLAPRYPNQLKGLIGIEESFEQIETLLKIGSSKVKTLGIWGMGGIGKTTLATALYDKLSDDFEGRCFIENVREKSDKLEALRDELFSKLLKNKNHGFDNFDMSRLQRKKVFIVLDDVATSEQLEKLSVEHDLLGPGSRVIVTTRNKRILSLVDEIYQVQDLSSHHSLQLFSMTAFGEKQPKDGYEDLSRRVVSYCKGIPLALKALGASLHSRSKEVWKCELRKLQKIPNMEIYKVLKLSYDDLDRTQQDIFLDIACFFKGGERGWVTRLLATFDDFFPASGIEVLLDKTLVAISDDNEIEMHDLIQEMGWEIVHQECVKDPGRRSRLWRPEEVHDVLKYNRGTDVVEGLIIDLSKLSGDLYLSSDSLAKMTNLRFLKIHRGYQWSSRFNLYLQNGLDSLSYKLRYLEWDAFCLELLPSNFCAEQLVELRMPRSKLKKLWDGVQNLVNLKIIDLKDSRDLIEFPDSSKAKKLESISLSGCKSLLQLHPFMLTLPKLIDLYLNGCKEIGSLNIDAKYLRELDLDGCSSLKDISVTSEEMTKLNLFGCTMIESLNVDSKYLNALCLRGCSTLKKISVASEEMTELNLSDTAISALSSSMLSLPNLTYLYLSDCREIESLNVESKYLRELDLNRCSSLKEISVTSEEMRWLNLSGTAICALPSSIGHLLSLGELDLSETNVESLPANIENLSMLKKLFLIKCRNLVSLQELPPSLRMLWLDDCKKLVSLPKLPPTMKVVRALNCNSMETKITQRLVLQHLLQSHIPYLHTHFHADYDASLPSGYIMFPGNHITDKCGFRTTENSITIPYLPISHLCGFIYCIILAGELSSCPLLQCHCSIYQDGIEVGKKLKNIFNANLTSDHVSFWYHDINKIDRISEVYDHFSNTTFKFEIELFHEEWIKGCGVFPVYATESGLKLVSGNSKELLEWESFTQISDNES
ncbi:TMV resistance protein N, partial [Mucuna pruriens]